MMENSEKRNNEIIIENTSNFLPKDKNKLLDEIMLVEKNAWPPELRASREKFQSRLEVFPEGFFLARVNGKLEGVSTSQIVKYNPMLNLRWDEITDSGLIKKTHNPSGNALYVVSVGVDKNSQGKGIGTALVNAQKALTVKLGLDCLFLGARMSGYKEYCKTYSKIFPEKYLNLKNPEGHPLDPEIRFYSKRGMIWTKVIADFESDLESQNYGVVMVWRSSKGL